MLYGCANCPASDERSNVRAKRRDRKTLARKQHLYATRSDSATLQLYETRYVLERNRFTFTGLSI